MSKQQGGITPKKMLVFFIFLLVYLLIIFVQYYRVRHFLELGSRTRVYREIVIGFIGLGGLSYALWIKRKDQI